MEFAGIVLIAFAPGVFWLWLVYRWDRNRPEPRWLVIRAFLWGILIVIPIGVIEFFMMPEAQNIGDSQSPLSLGDIAYVSFIVAGMTEELGKFLVIRLFVYRSPYFDDSTDGIVYSAATALGFASLENVGYILTYSWQVILVRGPISTFAHVLFSVIWGYPLALRKIGYHKTNLHVWSGLFAAMVAHGFFNFLLFTQSWYALMVFPLMAGLIVALNLMLRHSRRVSPFRNKVAELHTTCLNCGGKSPAYANYCTLCGKQINKEQKQKGGACGNCGNALEENARYCTSCGSRIVQKPLKK